MSEEEKYIKCQNCRQDIQESKKILHEAFCLKNNKFCGECGKIFLVNEFEEHLKTHNEKKQPPKVEPIQPKIENKNISSISEHRKNCEHHKRDIKNKEKEKIERPKIKPRVIDDNLGLKQCEFCTNMVEELDKHLKECKVKKMIEEENAKYYKDLERRNREDDNLARKLAKEKIMDISKDEQMARNLQNNLKPMIDTSKDEQMARNLQRDLGPMIDTSKDEQFARNLQSNMRTMIDTSKDAQFARNLQNKYRQQYQTTTDDEKIARDLQNQLNINNNNINKDAELARRLQRQERMNLNMYQNDYDVQMSDQNMNMDEDLKRAIEQSKKDYYH